ncbi:MAG: hypothetical protein IJ191_03340 [Treponema sp.]|nr:hypothetical protein [Treponema sp.]
MPQEGGAYILLGIKHSGKSTQGNLMAQRLRVPFYDTDIVMTELTQKLPRAIYAEHGAAAFKQAEYDACVEIASRCSVRQTVIATGGGICDNVSALGVLRPLGTFIFLRVSETTAIARIIQEMRIMPDGSIKNIPAYIASKRPRTASDVRAIFHEYYVQRTAAYGALADMTVVIENAPPRKNAATLQRALLEQSRGLALASAAAAAD